MQHKKHCSLLMAGLLMVAMAGCSSSPSEAEIMSALEKGTITVEDAKSKGWIDDAWIEKHFEPVEAKLKSIFLTPLTPLIWTVPQPLPNSLKELCAWFSLTAPWTAV